MVETKLACSLSNGLCCVINPNLSFYPTAHILHKLMPASHWILHGWTVPIYHLVFPWFGRKCEMLCAVLRTGCGPLNCKTMYLAFSFAARLRHTKHARSLLLARFVSAHMLIIFHCIRPLSSINYKTLVRHVITFPLVVRCQHNVDTHV